MYTLKSTLKRGTSFVAALAVAAATVVPAAPAFADALNPLTDRSLTLSSSAPGWQDKDGWYREQSVGRRFYALLCRCSGAAPARFETFIEALLERLAADPDSRDV